MLGFVLAHLQWDAISNLELQHSYTALQSDLVLPSAITFSSICGREYSVTMDAIMKQLPSRNEDSLALDGWTSMDKLARMWVIAYHQDRKWALREVQLIPDQVDLLFSSFCESQLWMMSPGPTYRSKASRTFEGLTWLFSVYQHSFGRNHDW